MRHPEFPVVSFLCIILLLCALPSHVRARSVCTMALIAWLAVMSIIRGVNSLIWANNFVVRLEVWCDITTKITIGFTYAVPASALCILRHLENVASTRNVRITKADKRRRQMFEALMCFGIPLLFMALHYIVQGHRFDIIEDVGCVPFVYFSIAAVIIVWVPPFLMSLITFVYAALTLRHFLRRRIEFAAHLQNSQSAISPGRYLRLMLMAVVEMIWDNGVNAYIIYFNTFTGLRPWISWENVHSNFSRVGIFPEFLIPPEFISQLIWQWWIVPISCITFFMFFGSGEEAMSDYRAAFAWVRRTIFRQHDSPKAQVYSISQSLPTHRQPPSNTYNVDIRSSKASDHASEHDTKPWGELSLEIPEFVTHTEQPSDSDPLPLVVRAYSPFTQEETVPAHVMPMLQSGTFVSTDQPVRTGSLDSSSLPVATHTIPPSHTQVESPYNVGAPDLVITQPDSIPTKWDDTDISTRLSTKVIPSATLHRSSAAILHPTSNRQSGSTDVDIVVSEAYAPDEVNSSYYHEEAFLVRSSTCPEQMRPLPHGGVRMTVEKSIV